MKKGLWTAALIAAAQFTAMTHAAEIQTPKPEMNQAHRYDTMRYSIDGSLVLTVLDLNSDTEIRVYDAKTMRFLRKAVISGSIKHFGLLPDNSGICYTKDRKLHLLNLATGTDTALSTADAIDRYCAAFSPDGTRFVAIQNNQADIISYPQGKLLTSFRYESRDYKLVVKFSHDGSMIAMGGPDSSGKVDLYSLTKGASIKLGGLFSGHSGQISDLCFSDDDTLLASCGGWGDKKAFIWNCATGKDSFSYTADSQGGFRAVYLKNNASTLLLINSDRKLCRIDIGKKQVIEEKTLKGQKSLDDYSVFSPDGEQFAIQPDRISIPLLYRSADAAPVNPGSAAALGELKACAFSGDGSMLYYASSEGIFQIKTLSGEQTLLVKPSSSYYQCAFNPDKKLIAYNDYRMKLYDITQGKDIYTADISMPAIGISGDGTYIIGASASQSTNRIEAVRINTKSGRKQTLSSPCSGWRIDGMQVSSDGRFAVCIPDSSRGFTFDFENNRTAEFSFNRSGIQYLSGDKNLLNDPVFIKSVPSVFFNSWYANPMSLDFTAKRVRSSSVFGSVCNYYSPDNAKLLIGFNNGSLQLYDAASMTVLGTAAVGNNSFGAIHPDGRYYGSSPEILALFHWVTGNETIALSDFGPQFFTPGILNEIITGKQAPSLVVQKPKPAVFVQRQLIGKIFAVEGNTVIVASTQSGSLVRGARLFVMPDDGGTVELTISMPMHTSAKCSLKDQGRKKSIRKGMPVFRE